MEKREAREGKMLIITLAGTRKAESELLRNGSMIFKKNDFMINSPCAGSRL